MQPRLPHGEPCAVRCVVARLSAVLRHVGSAFGLSPGNSTVRLRRASVKWFGPRVGPATGTNIKIEVRPTPAKRSLASACQCGHRQALATWSYLLLNGSLRVGSGGMPAELLVECLGWLCALGRRSGSVAPQIRIATCFDQGLGRRAHAQPSTRRFLSDTERCPSPFITVISLGL